MVRTVIVGTGDHAHGLAHLFSINNSESSGNILQITKKKLGGEMTFHDTGVPLVDFDEALDGAEVVILAIPAKALKIFVAENYSLLKDKILVDATNSSVKGEDLDELLSVTDLRWVKGFNDIGAVDALTKKPYGKKKMHSKMCSPSPEALETVKSIAETSFGLDIKTVPYEKYSEIAQHQDTLGEEWILATIIILITFALCMVYNIVRYVSVFYVRCILRRLTFHCIFISFCAFAFDALVTL